MNELLWFLNTNTHFELVSPMAMPLIVGFFLYQCHYILVTVRHLLLRAIHGTAAPAPKPGDRPEAFVTLPTLLRNDDELAGLKNAILSCAHNGYPGLLHVCAAIDDGVTRADLFAELQRWVATLEVPEGVRVYACCTPVRRGKAVAMDEAVHFMRRRVEEGLQAEFPPIFFNMDADSELGEHALTRMVDALHKTTWWTKQRRGIVTSNVVIAKDAYWKGWRNYFTMSGQISVHVAAEFLTALSMGRFNWKIHPVPGASGALYCTWSELHLMAPRWAAFMQTIKMSDWLGWWIGRAPPSFEHSGVGELPEATTGPGDDTWVTWLAFCARWVDGKITVELPRTPVHAFIYFVRSYFFRGLAYDVQARVATKTPTTVKALFKQRVRWNTSRVELAQRWTPALAFHWTAAFPAMFSTTINVYANAVATIALVTLPFTKLSVSFATLAFMYVSQTVVRLFFTTLALWLEGDLRREPHKLLGLVFAVPYQFVFTKLTTMVGYVQDVLLFGVNTKFAPEQTHIASKLPRFALAYRVRRALYLAVRAVVHNDVPLGFFWFGWHETEWTPSGFEGWTTGKTRVLKPRVAAVVAPAAPAPAMAQAGAGVEPPALAPAPAAVAAAMSAAAAPTIPAAPFALARAAAADSSEDFDIPISVGTPVLDEPAAPPAAARLSLVPRRAATDAPPPPSRRDGIREAA